MQVNSSNENGLHKDADSVSRNLDEAIEKIIQKEGFIKYEVDKQYVSTNNGNYLGILNTVDVKGETKDGKKELNLFMKSIKPKEDILEIFSITDLYKIEMFVYNDLFKIYEEFQKEANIPLEKRFKTVKGYDETNEEVIIMDNIEKKGFITYYRMPVATFEFAKLSIEQLAKFHALSLVLKERKPEYFEEKIKPLQNPVVFDEAWPTFVQRMKNATMTYVDDKYKTRVEKMFSDFVQSLPRYYHDESIRTCLCHGDYRSNNIMTKFENGKEVEVIPVDYQFIYYGSPISDFFYYMYSCTDREFRTNHMSDLKDLYYKELSEFLKYFGLDPEAVYSREEFEKTYKEKLIYGLMISLLFMVFVFVSEDGQPDMKGMNISIDERFRERLRGSLVEYEEWGLL